MTFEPNPVTTEQLVEYLTSKVGDNVGCNDIREAGKTLSISYATACKRLKAYKVNKGYILWEHGQDMDFMKMVF